MDKRTRAHDDRTAGGESHSAGAEHSKSLSIIIPVLNEAAHISTLLKSLSGYRRAGAEIIVVDGGSSDATRALAQGMADQVIDSARGRACQMNAGAAASRGDVLLFLHADTILPPMATTLILAGLGEDRHVWGRFDVRIEGQARMLKIIALLMNWRSRLTGIATGDQAIFVRRDAFQAVGGFPDQPLMEDIELSHRLKDLSTPVCISEKVTTSGRRWEARGMWRTILLMWSLRLLYWLGTAPEKLARAYR